MDIKHHLEAIDDALDNFAEDSSISLLDYAEAMEEIASRVSACARAAQNDLAAS